MKTTTAQELVEFTAEQLRLHYGPGPHADGSPQTVHGGGAGGGALQQRGPQQRRPKQVGDIGGTYDAPRVDAKRLLKTRAEFRSDRAREWGGDAKHSAGARRQSVSGRKVGETAKPPAETYEDVQKLIAANDREQRALTKKYTLRGGRVSTKWSARDKLERERLEAARAVLDKRARKLFETRLEKPMTEAPF